MTLAWVTLVVLIGVLAISEWLLWHMWRDLSEPPLPGEPCPRCGAPTQVQQLDRRAR